MPGWLGVMLALTTLIATVWRAGSTRDRTICAAVGDAGVGVGRVALRVAGWQLGGLGVLLLGYLLGFIVAHVTGRVWTSALFVLPVTVVWGSRVVVLAPTEFGPTAPEIMGPTGASRGVARAVLAVSFPFVLFGVSAATAIVLVSTQLFL